MDFQSQSAADEIVVQEVPMCMICLESINSRLLTTDCGHISHDNCLAGWACKTLTKESPFTCPGCRSELDLAIIPTLNKADRATCFSMRFLTALLIGTLVKEFPLGLVNYLEFLSDFLKKDRYSALVDLCSAMVLNDMYDRYIPLQIEKLAIAKKLLPITQALHIIKTQDATINLLNQQLQQLNDLRTNLKAGSTVLWFGDGTIVPQPQAINAVFQSILTHCEVLTSKKAELATAQQNYWKAHTRTIKNFLPEILTATVGFYCGYKYAAPVLSNCIMQSGNIIGNQFRKLSLTLS